MSTSCSRRPRNGLDNEFSGGSFQLPPFRLRGGAAYSPSPLPSGEVELRSNSGEGLRSAGGAEPSLLPVGKRKQLCARGEIARSTILGRGDELSSRLCRRRYWLHPLSHRQHGFSSLSPAKISPHYPS